MRPPGRAAWSWVGMALLLFGWGAVALGAPARISACVYFDGEENGPDYRVGERSAVMIRNLLGHFAEVEPRLSPVARYAPGGLAQCDRAIYVGTHFEAKMPESFVEDVSRYRRPFLWLNYGIWRLQHKLGAEKFREAWGFAYERIEGKMSGRRGEIPHFFRTVTYKGAAFRKVAFLDAQDIFIGHPEIVIVKNHSAQVLAETTHSGTGHTVPYATRKGDFFYVADNAVSVIDERDRYLVFADLLFDFLQLEPRSKKRYALARIEDIHPGYDLRLLHAAIEVFRVRKLPFAINLIPRYVGPGTTRGLDMTEDRRFLALLRHAIDSGASILVHGYEHLLAVDLGCGISYTGEGYEFWDVCNNRPLPFDSAAFVQGRLDKAQKLFRDAGIPYAGWVTPHYAASPLAMRLIHENFGRIVQRMTYYLEDRPIAPQNAIDQFFPYTIYRDYQGSHVWPENLGYVPLPRHGGTPRHVEEMLELAQLNYVVRDAWASFFWHPPLARTEIGLRSLERLVDGIRAQGYEFVSLQELRRRGE